MTESNFRVAWKPVRIKTSNCYDKFLIVQYEKKYFRIRNIFYFYFLIRSFFEIMQFNSIYNFNIQMIPNRLRCIVCGNLPFCTSPFFVHNCAFGSILCFECAALPRYALSRCICRNISYPWIYYPPN